MSCYLKTIRHLSGAKICLVEFHKGDEILRFNRFNSLPFEPLWTRC